jgi:signal transduction histidine kinase
VSRKSIFLIGLLTLVPILAFAWLGWRTARAEEARLQQQYQRLVEQRLQDENLKLQRYFGRLRRELANYADQCNGETNGLRNLVRTQPLIRQAIVLDRRGSLVYPVMEGEASDQEREFVREIQPLIADKDLVRHAFPESVLPSILPNTAPDPRALSQTATDGDFNRGRDEASQAPRQSSIRTTIADSIASTPSRVVMDEPLVADDVAEDGWHVWYFGRGIHLLFWRRTSENHVTVFGLTRARWIADLLGQLPDTAARARNADASPSRFRICLVDSAEQCVYQWGELPESICPKPLAEVSVSEPLASWRLTYSMDEADFTAASWFPVAAGLAGTTLGMLGLSLIVYREFSREVREAKQRVSFVNHVSHELKTPLTNIRMYGDLLELDLERLPASDAKQLRQRLEVIQGESQRLTQLITNVLTLARSERQTLTLHCHQESLDAIVRRVLDVFEPRLKAIDVQIHCDLNASTPAMLDGECVTQILNNLLSNVERYAADGKWVLIRTREVEGRRSLTIADRGPGVPPPLRNRIFEPFFRGANRLSDASGTGIGLTIARNLARLHGGDLTLAPNTSENPQGTTFHLIV